MQYAEAEKQIILNEMKDKGGNNKKKAEKMFDLPKEIFKQNSIAEFRYMQEMRKNGREASRAWHQESMANNTANSQATIDAIDGINVQDHVDDMNVAAELEPPMPISYEICETRKRNWSVKDASSGSILRTKMEATIDMLIVASGLADGETPADISDRPSANFPALEG